MLAHETAASTDTASMEPAIAKLASLERLALRRLAQLIAIIKDTVLEDHVSATHNTLDVTVPFNNAPMDALELVLAST